MIRFECDNCENVKGTDETWLLGFAAEAVGVASARREINMMSGWNYGDAVQPLAVHFCSEQCRDEYVNRLFGNETAMPVVERTKVIKRARTAPVVAERKIVKRVVARSAPVTVSKAKSKSRKRKAA